MHQQAQPISQANKANIYRLTQASEELLANNYGFWAEKIMCLALLSGDFTFDILEAREANGLKR